MSEKRQASSSAIEPTIVDVQEALTEGRRAVRPVASSTERAWLHPKIWLPPLVALGLLTLGWQLYAVHNPLVIPTVPQILSQIVDHPGLFWQNLLVTLQEAVVGALFGMLGAFVLALCMSQLPVIERAVMPIAVVLNVTPIIAIAPGLVVAFGFGLTPKYIVTGVIVFFPFLINSLVGLRSSDPRARDVLRTLHASQREILVRLEIPSSLPFLFAAARICMPLSVVGAVVAEFSAPGKARGLGSLIQTAASLSDLKTLYASVLVLAILGVVLTLVVLVLQRTVLAWRWAPSPRRA